MKKGKIAILIGAIIIVLISISIIIKFNHHKDITNYDELTNFIISLSKNNNLAQDNLSVQYYLPLDESELQDYVFYVDPEDINYYFFIVKKLDNEEKQTLQKFVEACQKKNPEEYRNISFGSNSGYTYIVSLKDETDLCFNAIGNFINNK